MSKAGIKNKTVVIGLDGATFNLIGPWIEEGKLPFIKELMDKGCSGVLQSTIPPISPVAWTSFMTGMNPGKHGIFDFMEPLQNGRQDIRFNNRMNCQQKPIWRYLNDLGYKTVILNVPMTFPPDELDGCMVSGMDTPSIKSEFTYPPSLKEELFRELGSYIIEVKHSPRLLSKLGKYIEALRAMIKKRREATKYLMERIPWDFFMVVFMAGDRAQHNLWHLIEPNHPKYNEQEARKYHDGMLWIYQELDKAVGDIVKSLDDETNIIIMSDHGADILYKTVHLNNWLAEKGFLVIKRQQSNAVHYLSDFIVDAWAIFKKLKYKFFKKGEEHFSQFFKSIDWSKTKAFFLGAWGKIFINVKGKYPFGIVEPGQEYEEVRNQIIEELMKLKDPDTGKSVVNRVIKKEDIYSGDCFSHAPDLVIIWEKGYNSITKSEELWKGIKPCKRGEIFEPHRRMSADHIRDGIFIIRSSHVEKNRGNLRADIIDICPTILYMMDTPIPESMDGRVLTEIFKKTSLKDRPIERLRKGGIEVEVSETPGYSPEEAKKIEEKLKNLGYID